MTRYEKAKERLKSLPTDYTYAEANALLNKLGFFEDNKGKTSGSRVKFVRQSDRESFLMHKPHPSDIMNRKTVLDLKKFLERIGEL